MHTKLLMYVAFSPQHILRLCSPTIVTLCVHNYTLHVYVHEGQQLVDKYIESVKVCSIHTQLCTFDKEHQKSISPAANCIKYLRNSNTVSACGST